MALAYTTDEYNIIRTYLVERITLVVDSDEHLNNRLIGAAHKAAREMGGPAAYAAMLDAGTGSHAHVDYARKAGAYIMDVLREEIADLPAGTMRMIVGDVFNLSDEGQVRMFGAHFLPERVEDIDWNESDDE